MHKSKVALGIRPEDHGAGVVAPGWSKHLWQMRGRADASSVWLARIAGVLRVKGHMISTASLIEAERLARALAAIRERPNAGFEELRDAAVSVLFNGDPILWRVIEAELLLGNDVGEIPPDVPLAPLIEDLQRCQKEARLKPEALERELSIDLRSESGLYRSTLLHRLNVLGVPWGTLTDAGRSRGTFRERWMLRWEPEYSVRLVENLVHGPTIAKAANGRLIQMLAAAETLDALAKLVQGAITADLDEASAAGLAALEQRAALSSNCQEMLASIPPLADITRYGEARRSDAGRLTGLLEQLTVEAAIALPHAARDLDADAAAALVAALRAADTGIRLVEAADNVLETWRRGLHEVLDSSRSTALVARCVAHLLYEAELLQAEEAAQLLQRRLSPGTPVVAAAGFFEGFFSDAGQRLIYDEALRDAVDAWLKMLDNETFVAHLPLLRRVFSNLDRMERRRLIEAVLGRTGRLPATLVPAPDNGQGWRRHLELLRPILTGPMDETMDASDEVQAGRLSADDERERRWRLAVGADDEQASTLSDEDRRLSAALNALYGDGADEGQSDSRKRRGGLGRSAPRVAQWMGDIRTFFPQQVVQILQKDAFERLDLKQMLMEPEFLKAIEADVNLVADLISLRNVMPSKTKDLARGVIADIVAKLIERLEQKTAEAIRGALDKSRRTNRPRHRLAAHDPG